MSDAPFRTAGLALLRPALAVLGVGVWCVHRVWCALFNPGGQPLTDPMRRVVGPCLPSVDLDRVRVHPHARLALPARFRALTLGRRIYVRGPLHPESLVHMRLLLHELVHVAQWERDPWGWLGFAARYGAGVAGAWGWAAHPMECEAVDHEHASEGTLERCFREEWT